MTYVMISIRAATKSDVRALCALDLVARENTERQELIRRSVASGLCFVVETGAGQIAAYGVLSHTFFRHGFVEMLYVDSDFRRQGCGTALLRHMAKTCRSPKLFASTNASNPAMQSLLEKEGFRKSGVIHNLDEDDPELVYFKLLGEP